MQVSFDKHSCIGYTCTSETKGNGMELHKKSDLMKNVVRGIGREVFEHSEEGVFDVTAMRQYCTRIGLKPVLLEVAAILPYIKETRVHEMSRVYELSAYDCRNDPALGVEYPDGTHLYIDGTHRALRLDILGVLHQPLWLLKESEIIRPDLRLHSMGDWGDEFKDGKIIKRGQS